MTAFVAGKAGGLAIALLKKATPALAAMGAGGYVAYQATSAIDGVFPQGPAHTKEHRDAVVGAFAPVPGTMAGLVGISKATSLSRGTKITVQKAVNAATREAVQLELEHLRGWTIGPSMLRAGSVGMIGGSLIAVGLAVPVAAMGADLLGKALNTTVKVAMPDWLQGAAAPNPAMIQAVAGVGEAVVKLNEGRPPTVVKVSGTIDRDPNTPLDVVKELGLDQPIDETTDGRVDRRRVVSNELVRRLKVAGADAEAVEPKP